MSQVERAKTVTPNFMAFTWNGLGFVRGEQAKGEYARAAALLCQSISYLPPDVKDRFREAANLILSILGEIQSGSLFPPSADLYLTRQHKHRILETFGNQALNYLIDQLTTTLNEKGYMERVDESNEGFGSTSRRQF